MTDLRNLARNAGFSPDFDEYVQRHWQNFEKLAELIADDAIPLRAALAQQPVQVPVAWIRKRDNTIALSDGGVFGDNWTLLYATSPQRKPLTDDEIAEICMDCSLVTPSDIYFARAIEKAHGIE